MKSIIKIFNGKVITPFRIIPHGTVIVKDGKISEISDGNMEASEAIEIDAQGKYISPGFIDIHVHGGGGHDFMDGTVEAFVKVAELHARYGTTSMLPTTLTSEVEELYVTLDNYKKAKELNKSGSEFLGIHLEGPYFSVNQRGAQDPRYIRNPDPKEYKEILDHSDDIRRWSAAPELPGAIEFAHYVKSKGILVALAHTDATFDEALTGFENGYTLATHFYSCMRGVTRMNALRYAGTIEAGYLIDEMDVEVIADGIHCPPPLLKLIYKVKGADRTALITDSMRAAGMPEGESILGSRHNGLKVIVEDGVAKLPDRTSFAGSVATTDRLVRTMVKQADIPLADAVRMATATPARILGIDDNKGSLIQGKDADILIFDDDIQIQKTIIKGKIIYEKA
ncbi:MAG: N-acetylglucosamine-6-phosphate deacetylase [Chitinophagaceae bacterium]|jgi:N-acetylglucosamine-6-phosphate deacetylase|nr:MAG: N-acetylglucosamine-6-phosphate deacetylase [Chitinophagaceae bacterium]